MRGLRSFENRPSARYLGLVREGARENDLPREYQDWLESFEPYEIPRGPGRLGQVLMASSVLPIFLWQIAALKIFVGVFHRDLVPRWHYQAMRIVRWVPNRILYPILERLCGSGY